jgi:predicted nuclease of predicted toxin-antitoxin system
MMLKFIVDTQLPPLLAKYLHQKGYDAVHTTHFLDGHLLQDEQITIIAIAESRIVVTKDSDFLDHYMLHGVPPNVLLLQFGNVSNKELLTMFEANFVQITTEFENGAEVVLFNKLKIVTY